MHLEIYDTATIYTFGFCFYFQILMDAKTLSSRLKHRGACSCDNDTGDGAGVLTAIPHQLYASILRYIYIYIVELWFSLTHLINKCWVCREDADIELPPMGQYATGICFVDEAHHAESEAMFQEIARECSLQVRHFVFV